MRKAREFIASIIVWIIAGLVWLFDVVATPEFKAEME
jgi:hypothetical protein